VTVPVPDDAELAARAAEGDRTTASLLAAKLRGRIALGPEDVRAAEDLFARYPEPARDLLEAVLLGAAKREREARRYEAAVTLLRRAAEVAPGSPRPPQHLLALYMEAADWVAAEGIARAMLAVSPADAEAASSLGYALVRQDRAREALDFLTSYQDAHPDPKVRVLLERIRHDSQAESALDERYLAHFHVRYDGEAHEDVGREILRVLDRHYATLVRTFDHQPAAPIPVILLSRESYYDATGAPAWSGGQYDSFDGRVRIPIGGLDRSLTPDLDETLIHELTHAFVADISRGLAPREIHEGLAQFMEGKRADAVLGEEGLRALAGGRIPGVAGFYMASLSFVEDLVAQRSQGGVNDLLRAMAETRSADEAFRRVYGKDLAGLKMDWALRLRHRHGG
jgi:tetratricopeptide (TPR) repeat protein